MPPPSTFRSNGAHASSPSKPGSRFVRYVGVLPERERSVRSGGTIIPAGASFVRLLSVAADAAVYLAPLPCRRGLLCQLFSARRTEHSNVRLRLLRSGVYWSDVMRRYTFVIRNFKNGELKQGQAGYPGHPDFEKFMGAETGIVKSTLGSDKVRSRPIRSVERFLLHRRERFQM